MRLTSSDIATIVKGRLVGLPDLIVTEIVTDSRQVSFAEGVAFVALRGKNHDGSRYISALYQKGVKIFITGIIPEDSEAYKDAAFILNNDTTAALQSIAAHIRRGFSFPVIAVTGSTGKTIVKEWLADVIGLTAPVVRSPKSYNSQIGVPLSVLKLDSKFRFGIFEAGISLPGEMEKLRAVIDPDIGIITNIGDAHSENFPDNKTKAIEKLKLFVNARMIIYCSDQTLIRDLILNDSNLRNKELIDWSFNNPEAAIFVKIGQMTGRTILETVYKGKRYNFEIPFTDRASVENAITVSAACFALGIEPGQIQKGVSELVSVAMRMEMKNGINNCLLIEDFYNSDPGSLGMALEFLKSQKNRKTTLILSDFIQSGRDEKELYTEVAELIRKTGIDRFIGIGQALSGNSS